MKFSLRIVSTLVAVALLSSCITSKSVKINALQSSPSMLAPNQFVFYYPKTVLTFQVTCLREQFIPGPYANYSRKYIGATPFESTTKENWRMLHVSLLKSNEPDFSRLFSVEGTPSEVAKVFRAVNSGNVFVDEKQQGVLGIPEVFPQASFLDMGVTPFISNEKSVFYTSVQVDSGFVRVPVQKNIVVESNLENKAKEAAEFIFSLRKRRFDIVSGEVDHAQDGKALEVSLAELKRLEDSYLSLFVGKVLSDTVSFSYSYVPTSATSQNSILFRFSEDRGVLNADDLSGRPVMLELVAEKNQESLKLLGAPATPKGTVLFPYLFPEVCSVALTDGKNSLLRKRTPINQLGQVVYFPVSILK